MTDEDAHMKLLKEVGYLKLELIGMEERLYQLIHDLYPHQAPWKEADRDG